MIEPSDIRALLNAHDTQAVTLHWLTGTIDVTEMGDSSTKIADNGDRAFVVLGPADKVNIQRSEADAKITYTLELPTDRARDNTIEAAAILKKILTEADYFEISNDGSFRIDSRFIDFTPAQLRILDELAP